MVTKKVYLLLNSLLIFSRSDKTRIGDREKTTTRGWFQISTFEEFDASNLSQGEKDFIQEQLSFLNDISNSLPYAAMVWKGYSFQDAENISYEILGDLKEVANAFHNHLSGIKEVSSKAQTANRTLEDPKAKADKQRI